MSRGAYIAFVAFVLVGALDYLLGTQRMLLLVLVAFLLAVAGLFRRIETKLDTLINLRLQNQTTLERCIVHLSAIRDAAQSGRSK